MDRSCVYRAWLTGRPHARSVPLFFKEVDLTRCKFLFETISWSFMVLLNAHFLDRFHAIDLTLT